MLATRFFLGLVSCLAGAALMHGAVYTIGGVPYYTTTTTENVTAPFINSSGVQTVNSYYGLILVSVSGTGQSDGSDVNDAFYDFNPGPPTHDASYYQVAYSHTSLAGNPSADAYNFIVYDVNAGTPVTPPYTPAYKSNHTYSFIVPAGPLSQLYFGLMDQNYADNSGSYSITVTQLFSPPADAYQVTYAANLAVTGTNIDITNAGTTGPADPANNVCANLYVFAQDQQLIECCSCPVTPNDLQTITGAELISNTLTPGAPTGITVGLLASAMPAGGFCNAAGVNPTALVPGVRAWGTVVHATSAAGYALTENPFSLAGLSATEFSKMVSTCAFIQANGSFFGICKGCSQGAAGAAKGN